MTALKDTRRFMRSPEGHAWLTGIRAHLQGLRIRRVAFAATDKGIATTLHLDNCETYRFIDEELMLETLREQFSGVFRELDSQIHTRKEE